jgi:hypothetical protein
MGRKHQTTFASIHEKPDRKDIDWGDFINLLEFLGATIKYSGGSAVGIRLNEVYAVFHKPHPGHEIYPSDLKRIRRFFETAGVKGVE